MSTILDALKKSEQERRLTKVPTLSDLPAPEESSRWPLVIGAVIALLLLILIFVLLMTRTSGGVKTPVTVSTSITQTEDNRAELSNSQISETAVVIVNVVSYSAQPANRFVMINGKMFREGEFVRAGLKVVEITQESVVLNDRGRRVVRKP